MLGSSNKHTAINWHRIITVMVLCLFGIVLVYSAKPKRQRQSQKKEDPRVYLVHSDELQYDMYGPRPTSSRINSFIHKPQICRGNVEFLHKGATLKCDSAYFYEELNSFEAFSNVRLKQGDTLTLVCDYAWYDGDDEMMAARGLKKNVVLTHRKSKLFCDSLNYDRMYNIAYFFEGGRLVDQGSTLTSDWGQYNTENKEAVFYYNVKLHNKTTDMQTDTLYYDTKTSLAHAVGMRDHGRKQSIIVSNQKDTIYTVNGYYNSKTDHSELYGRSTVHNDGKTITADSLYSDAKTSVREGFGNVIYHDPVNKNIFKGDYLWFKEDTGEGLAHDRAVLMDYSQGPDTLYMHADSIRMYTHYINTDSVYRMVHAYPHVRAFRRDMQAVCDSMTVSSLDSCMTMYKDPIVWNFNRQILGEVIHAYTNDSTLRYADVIGQALSVEQLDNDTVHYNQVSSKEMQAYFIDGSVRQTKCIGNVQSIYYPIDDSDSLLIGLNYLETDTMKMFITPERKLDYIWTSKGEGTLYPITQIPPEKYRLSNFAWFDYIRPRDKDDIFEWRPKSASSVLKEEKRREAPKRKR